MTGYYRKAAATAGEYSKIQNLIDSAIHKVFFCPKLIEILIKAITLHYITSFRSPRMNLWKSKRTFPLLCSKSLSLILLELQFFIQFDQRNPLFTKYQVNPQKLFYDLLSVQNEIRVLPFPRENGWWIGFQAPWLGDKS